MIQKKYIFYSIFYSIQYVSSSEPVFVNFLRSPGIDSQPGGIDSQLG
jgi:hypothetical protein